VPEGPSVLEPVGLNTEVRGMTPTIADPPVRPRRAGVDFIDEASRAAAVARSNAKVAQKYLRAAHRLRKQAAAHERDARCHEEAVLVMVSLAEELRR
jgi:hypothetical protein